MSISNYSELQTAVANYLHRTDLTSQIPDFISFAEAKLNRTLRLRAMENIATGSISATVALPTGFLEAKGISASSGGSTWPLTYITPSEINTDVGSSSYYSIVGDNMIFQPSASGGTYTLVYYKKFDPLSSGVNWLITNAPDVYVYASCIEACEYTRDTARIADLTQLLAQSIDQLTLADKKDRYGSNLVVRAA